MSLGSLHLLPSSASAPLPCERRCSESRHAPALRGAGGDSPSPTRPPTGRCAQQRSRASPPRFHVERRSAPPLRGVSFISRTPRPVVRHGSGPRASTMGRRIFPPPSVDGAVVALPLRGALERSSGTRWNALVRDGGPERAKWDPRIPRTSQQEWGPGPPRGNEGSLFHVEPEDDQRKEAVRPVEAVVLGAEPEPPRFRMERPHPVGGRLDTAGPSRRRSWNPRSGVPVHVEPEDD